MKPVRANFRASATDARRRKADLEPDRFRRRIEQFGKLRGRGAPMSIDK